VNTKQSKMAEALMDMQMKSEDARWLQGIIIDNSELSPEDDYRLIGLYDEEFGYGIEE